MAKKKQKVSKLDELYAQFLLQEQEKEAAEKNKNEVSEIPQIVEDVIEPDYLEQFFGLGNVYLMSQRSSAYAGDRIVKEFNSLPDCLEIEGKKYFRWLDLLKLFGISESEAESSKYYIKKPQIKWFLSGKNYNYLQKANKKRIDINTVNIDGEDIWTETFQIEVCNLDKKQKPIYPIHASFESEDECLAEKARLEAVVHRKMYDNYLNHLGSGKGSGDDWYNHGSRDWYQSDGLF